MNVLFLFPYPLGHSPSQRFRFEQYFEKLEAQGIRFWCQPFWDTQTWTILYKSGYLFSKIIGLIKGLAKRFWCLWSVYKYDIVFIHRECTPIGPPVIEWFIAKVFKKKIIYDFDDAIWLPNTSTENRIAGLIKCHWKVKLICKWSYKISCGNNFLGDLARQFSKSIVINPTTIDTDHFHNPSLFKIDKPLHSITIGWTGTHSTLKYLNFIVPVIQKLETKYSNLRFVIIANKKPDFVLKSLQFIPWNKANEIKDLLMIDIGIMPLTDDIWSQAKCGFKALQYMALSIPSVASPVGVNSKIIDHTLNGFLCEKDEDWFNQLSFLIEHKEQRLTMGIDARKKIIDQYSVSSNSSNFLSLFE